MNTDNKATGPAILSTEEIDKMILEVEKEMEKFSDLHLKYFSEKIIRFGKGRKEPFDGSLKEYLTMVGLKSQEQDEYIRYDHLFNEKLDLLLQKSAILQSDDPDSTIYHDLNLNLQERDTKTALTLLQTIKPFSGNLNEEIYLETGFIDIDFNNHPKGPKTVLVTIPIREGTVKYNGEEIDIKKSVIKMSVYVESCVLQGNFYWQQDNTKNYVVSSSMQSHNDTHILSIENMMDATKKKISPEQLAKLIGAPLVKKLAEQHTLFTIPGLEIKSGADSYFPKKFLLSTNNQSNNTNVLGLNILLYRPTNLPDRYRIREKMNRNVFVSNSLLLEAILPPLLYEHIGLERNNINIYESGMYMINRYKHTFKAGVCCINDITCTVEEFHIKLYKDGSETKVEAKAVVDPDPFIIPKAHVLISFNIDINIDNFKNEIQTFSIKIKNRHYWITQYVESRIKSTMEEKFNEFEKEKIPWKYPHLLNIKKIGNDDRTLISADFERK